MQQHSNAYIIGFAAIVCLVCSIVVSTSAVALRPRQLMNMELDRQKQVLTVAGLIEAGQKVQATEIGELFSSSIVARVIELETGAYDESVDPASFDQRKAEKDPAMSRPAGPNNAGVIRLPTKALLYQKVVEGKIEMLILPIEGKGLWSTLYGYLALDADTTTIRGITFYDQKETAGLGGEIANPAWQAKWPGRRAFDDSGQIAIEVVKGAAGPPAEDPYRVDGLSGATITSRGVSHLVRFWLSDEGFGPYLDRFRSEKGGDA